MKNQVIYPLLKGLYQITKVSRMLKSQQKNQSLRDMMWHKLNIMYLKYIPKEQNKY